MDEHVVLLLALLYGKNKVSTRSESLKTGATSSPILASSMYASNSARAIPSLVPRLSEQGEEEMERLVSTASRSGCVTAHEDKI